MSINDYIETENGKVIPVEGSLYELRKASPFTRLIIKNQKQMFELSDGDLRNVSYIESVIILEGVYEIPNNAFCGFKSLRTIKLPSTLLLIGEGAFEACTSLERIVIPDGVNEINRRTFEMCTKLKEVYIPDSVTVIHFEVFRNCTSLEYITGGRGLKCIDFPAFVGCSSLKEVPTPLSLTEISCLSNFQSAHLFSDFLCEYNKQSCVNAEGDVLQIKDGVKVICRNALSEAVDKAVILPDTVRNISLFAFCDNDKRKPYDRLPKSMNKPKDYFRKNCNHDFPMSFLLIDTVWKNRTDNDDLINIYLYHNDEAACMEACRRLWKDPDGTLRAMLSAAATESDKHKMMQRIGTYAAAYLPDISNSTRSYFYKRLHKIGEDSVYDLVIRQRMDLQDIIPGEAIDLLGTDGLEPYFMEKYLENSICISPFTSQLDNVRMKDGSIAPREFVLSILYAYVRENCFYSPKLYTYPDYSDALEKADKAVELLDSDSLVRFINYLRLYPDNQDFLEPLRKSSHDIKSDEWSIMLYAESLAEEYGRSKNTGSDRMQDDPDCAEEELDEGERYRRLAEEEECEEKEYEEDEDYEEECFEDDDEYDYSEEFIADLNENCFKISDDIYNRF